MEKFLNREEAGKILAEQLKRYARKPNVLVLALPRGGVPVAYEIAQMLSVPLDVFIVRKLGVPGHEELAMGAIAMDGTTIFNEDIVRDLAVTKKALHAVVAAEQIELKRRNRVYRLNRPFPVLTGKTIILVDDGVATGATLRAAIQALKQKIPARIVVAVPVADVVVCAELAKQVDQMICLIKTDHLYAVGAWYEDFSQTTDAEVSRLLG